MEIPFDDVTRYGLVNSDPEVKQPSDKADNTTLQTAKLQAYRRFREYNGTDLHSAPDSVKNALLNVMSMRGLELFESIKSWSEAFMEEHPPQLAEWNGQETVVTHMAFDIEFPADGSFENPQMLQGRTLQTPVYYLVRDFNRGPKINLPRQYLDSYHQRGEAARLIREHLARVWRTQGQSLFTASTKHDSQMQKLYFDEKIAELVRVTSEANYAGRLCVNFTYETDYADRFVFPFTGGTMTMEIQQGVPILSGLTDFNYPEHVQRIINETLKENGTGTNVLFVKLNLLFTDEGRAVQHYLLLSEYDKDRLSMLVARGLESDWENTMKVEKMAIGNMRMYSGRGFVRVPYPEDKMIDAMIQGVNTSLLRERNVGMNILEGRDDRLHDDYRAFMTRLRATRDLDNTEVSPIRHYFFSADGLCVQMTLFNLAFDDNRMMLGLSGPDKGNYCVVTIVQYPVLYYDVERRYMTSRTIHRARARAAWFRPTDFQAEGPVEHYNNLRYVDRYSRETFPLRDVIALPPRASYAAMVRRRVVSEPENPLPFFVNNMEEDPQIVYVTYFSDESLWNSMAMFRLEAEARVSQFMLDHDMPIFYQFRQEMPPYQLFPFKAYLNRYPEARAEWARIWREAYNGMTGFTAIIQPNEESRNRERQREEQWDPNADWQYDQSSNEDEQTEEGEDDDNNREINDEERRIIDEVWGEGEEPEDENDNPMYGAGCTRARLTTRAMRPKVLNPKVQSPKVRAKLEPLNSCRRSGLVEARSQNEEFLLRRLRGVAA